MGLIQFPSIVISVVVMKEHILIGKTCKEQGVFGLVFKDIGVPEDQVSVTTTADLLCHDLVDHQNGLEAIGTAMDEFQAVGGNYINRNIEQEMYDDYHGKTAFERGMRNDTISIFIDVIRGVDYQFDRIEKDPEMEMEHHCEYLESALFEIKDTLLREVDDLDEDEVNEILQSVGLEGLDDFIDQARRYTYLGISKALSERDEIDANDRRMNCLEACERAVSKLIPIGSEMQDDDVFNQCYKVKIIENDDDTFECQIEDRSMALNYSDIVDNKNVITVGVLNIDRSLKHDEIGVISSGSYDVMVNEDHVRMTEDGDVEVRYGYIGIEIDDDLVGYHFVDLRELDQTMDANLDFEFYSNTLEDAGNGNYRFTPGTVSHGMAVEATEYDEYETEHPEDVIHEVYMYSRQLLDGELSQSERLNKGRVVSSEMNY